MSATTATIEDSTRQHKDLPDDIPEPVIKIDNHTDPYHTIVSITYGNRLGELLDTVRLPLSCSLNLTTETTMPCRKCSCT